MVAAGLSSALVGCEREWDNPSDPQVKSYEVKSEAFIRVLGDGRPQVGDTLRIIGGLTSPPVEDKGLVVDYDWDLDGDGIVDTTLHSTDTLALVAFGLGRHQMALTLTDRAGFKNMARVEYQTYPNWNGLFDVDFNAKAYDSTCPIYAQEPVLMRLALTASQFTVEKNREEGIGAADFAIKLAQALTGSAFPLTVLQGFDFSFSKGVYRFRNDGFDLDLSFHYGAGISGHTEGDTVMANLFSLDSYVKNIDVSVLPPSLHYQPGPLASLIDGEIAVDIEDIVHPHFDFKVDFNRLRFSFFRQSRSLLVLSNAEITLANAFFFTLYEGKARLAPIYPPEIIRLYGRDSLAFDFSGTQISSPELPIRWTYSLDGKQDSGIYRLALEQEFLRQSYRFGDAGGVQKVFGDYQAVNRLGEQGDLQEVFFQGNYSSTSSDSARFFCQESMAAEEMFGQSTFETETPGRGRFLSGRFEYGFSFPFSTVEPWKGDIQEIPVSLRDLL